MKDYSLAIVFTQTPFGNASSREGLDALLAACAFCEETDILICFLNDGVFNLVAEQQPERILQKDHLSAFKLLELYGLSECFVCQESIVQRQLSHANWSLSGVQFISQQAMFERLKGAKKILTF